MTRRVTPMVRMSTVIIVVILSAATAKAQNYPPFLRGPRHVPYLDNQDCRSPQFCRIAAQPLFCCRLDPRGWAHAASVSFGFRVASKRLGNYGSKRSSSSAGGIFFLVAC